MSVFFYAKMKIIFKKYLIKPLHYNIIKKENKFQKTAIILILINKKKIYFKRGMLWNI